MRHRAVALWIAGGIVIVVLVALCGAYWFVVMCKGKWHGEALEQRRPEEVQAIERALRADVEYMSVTLGERNPAHYDALVKCGDWVKKRWQSQGYSVQTQAFTLEGRQYENLGVEMRGTKAPSEIIVFSAQYDTLPGSPGANNNASGMAVLLQLSELLKGRAPARTLRLMAFTTEEDPYFGTDLMGSYHYARRCRELGEDILVMVSMDAMGYYVDTPHSQNLPFPFSLVYPSRGNFLAFIGDLGSRRYMVELTKGFQKGSSFPIEAAVVPRWVKGAAWSDHVSFWRCGYPGMQVTDTGAFRSPWHTNAGDTMDKMSFSALARITLGMCGAAMEITQAGEVGPAARNAG
jgi:hypothetical protein